MVAGGRIIEIDSIAKTASRSGVSELRLVLYEPDIPQNTAAMLRFTACLGVGVDIIEPCGFLFDESRMRRVGMDYLAKVSLRRHPSWSAFREETARTADRLVLLTTQAELRYTECAFRPGDRLMVGRESAGVPDAVHASVDERISVPMAPGLRSLNVVTAAAMVLGEALRQTGGFPAEND